MDDIPGGMPGVARAMKVQKRARSVGFDWDSAEDVVAVLRGEIVELEDAHGDAESVADELGDVLFTAVNLARHLGVDPEVALRSAVDKFIERFMAWRLTLPVDRLISRRSMPDNSSGPGNPRSRH